MLNYIYIIYIIYQLFVIKELEMPLQLSLCNMEHYGFPANANALLKLYQHILDTMKKLENRIYALHGSRFNLSSASTVAKVQLLNDKLLNKIDYHFELFPIRY